MLLNLKLNKICGMLKVCHNTLKVTSRKLRILKVDLLRCSSRQEFMHHLKEVIHMNWEDRVSPLSWDNFGFKVRLCYFWQYWNILDYCTWTLSSQLNTLSRTLKHSNKLEMVSFTHSSRACRPSDNGETWSKHIMVNTNNTKSQRNKSKKSNKRNPNFKRRKRSQSVRTIVSSAQYNFKANKL